MISRNEAHRLARDAADLGAQVLRGTVALEADGVKVGDTSILDWLAQLNGSELMLIAVPVGKVSKPREEVQSCNTCGRDYTGTHCPYCAEAWARLRG
jgi:hypothetical protein